MPRTAPEFGRTLDGASVHVYPLTNSKGMNVRILDYGGIISSLTVPDRSGKMADVTLGFESFDGYAKGHPYFGALIGRYGNRIAKGRFQLDGVTYQLPVNNGENSLHGGDIGFDKKIWKVVEYNTESPAHLLLTYTSPDGEQGYPGTLTATARYTVTPNNELRIDYRVTSDKATVQNLTNHAYWNLAGAGSGDILGHEMQINADLFTPVDAGLIPTGELRSVGGTPFDFRQPKPIGRDIQGKDEQLTLGKGYDHNFVLNRTEPGLSLAARVREPASGRVMEVLTTEPGVQFYTGNFLDGTLTGKGGKVYGFRNGFCLETQHFPDSPNQPKFPSTVLRPGQAFTSSTVYRFLTDQQ